MKFCEISENGRNFVEFLTFCEKGDFHEKWSPESLKSKGFVAVFARAQKGQQDFQETSKF